MSSSRSHRARALARRVERQHRVLAASAQWAVVTAVWLHLGAVVALRIVSPTPLPVEADDRYLEVIRTAIATDGPSHAAGPATPGAPARDTPDGPERPSPPDGVVARRVREDPAERRRVVRSDQANTDLTPVIDTISAHHVASDDETSAPVTSDRDGLPTPISKGVADLAGSPTLDRREGDPDAAQGNRTDREPGPVVLGGGGGGAPAPRAGRGQGAPQLGEGPTDDGGALPATTVGAEDRSLAASGAASSLAVTAPVGPQPTHEVGAAAPDWWQPLAVRVAPTPASAPLGAPDPPVVPADVPRPVAGARAGRRGVSGGARLVANEPPLAALPEEEQGVRRIAAVGTADPVDELREALGFGPLDRTALAPRPTWAGLQRQQGMQDSSPQAALDAPIAWRTAFSARGTAEGAYIQRASEQIGALWQRGDLDLDSRASGLQGEVTVRYEVRRDGRTRWVRVVRSSGNPVLDELARAAIPARLERFPSELRQDQLQHEITFRYRNPSVGP